MKRAHIPRLRYKPCHRGGWFRGYNGPTAAPVKHEGATKTSPLPTAEVRAVGEDPLLTAQIAIHQEVSAEAAAIEAAKVQAAKEKLELSREFDAAFAPIKAAIDDTFDRLFFQIAFDWNIPVSQMDSWYVDAVRAEAEAEHFAREAVTEDIYATGEFDVDELNQLLTAEALLVA